ncbi:cytochrome P450 [Streptomyces sp. NPDC001107]
MQGQEEAREVLSDARAFRPAATDEYVPGYSRSFFLATDTSSPSEKARFRSALAGAVSPQRIASFKQTVLHPTANRIAAGLPVDKPIDLIESYVRPYNRQASYALAGLPNETGAELAARVQVATKLLGDGDTRPVARALFAEVNSTLRTLATDGQLASTGLPGHALARGLITVEDVPALTVPILEMAASDMSAALTFATVEAVCALSPSTQQSLLSDASAREAVWEAARTLPDIYVTRVAARPVVLGGQHLRAGHRVLLDIPSANADPRAFAQPKSFAPERNADHLAFGHGEHLCMGRELALSTAVAALQGLLRRGHLVPIPGRPWQIARLLPHLNCVGREGERLT